MLLLFVLPSCVSISSQEPLSGIDTDRGMLVLDGAERVAVTQESNDSKSSAHLGIPWNWFD